MRAGSTSQYDNHVTEPEAALDLDEPTRVFHLTEMGRPQVEMTAWLYPERPEELVVHCVTYGGEPYPLTARLLQWVCEEADDAGFPILEHLNANRNDVHLTSARRLRDCGCAERLPRLTARLDPRPQTRSPSATMVGLRGFQWLSP